MKRLLISLVVNVTLLHSMQITKETNEEFISRTKILSCSKRYTNLLSDYFIEPRAAAIGYYAMCPDNTSHVLLRPAEEERKAQLVVLNDKKDVYARQFLGYKKYLAVALAAQRNLFATIHETPEHEILKIRRVDTKKTLKKIKIPTYFQVACALSANSVIAFNKQGTDIIVWGVNVMQPGRDSHRGNKWGVPALDYMIFNFEEELKAQKFLK